MKRTSFKFFYYSDNRYGIFLSSCERVAPNYAGVLMENYGKQGKEDFKVVSGRISNLGMGHGIISSPAIRPTRRVRKPCHVKKPQTIRSLTHAPLTPTRSSKNRAIDVVFR